MTVKNADEAVTLDVRALDVACAQSGIRTTTQLARRAGISRSLGYLVRSGYGASPETRAKIATALGCSVTDLWKPAVQP